MEGAPSKILSVRKYCVKPNEKCRQPVAHAPQSLFAKKKQAQKTGFEKERKDPLRGERLPNDSAGGFGKGGPIGAKLKFHRNAGSHAYREVNRCHKNVILIAMSGGKTRTKGE